MKHPNYFALAIGTSAAIAAAVSVFLAAEFRLSSEVTPGTVVRLNTGGHHPRIAFEAIDGRHYERATGTIMSYEAGESVPIRYNAHDPAGSAVIDSALDLWATSVFLFILAIGFLDAAVRGEPLRKGLR